MPKDRPRDSAETARLLEALINGPGEIVIFSLDGEGRYTAFNERHREEMLRVWNADIRVGVNLLECMTDPRLRALARGSIERALGGEAFTEVNHQPDLDIHYEFSWGPIRGPGGRIDGVTAFIRDITERVRSGEALRRSEERFRNLFEHNAAIKLIIDPGTGAIVDANHAAVTFYGWSRDQLRRMRIQEINTLTPAEVEREMARARGLGDARFEFRHRIADGSIRDVDVFTSRFELDGREFLHSIVHDSTARRQAERALRVAEARLAVTSRLASMGTLVAGVAHEINNPLAAALSGQEMAGRTVRELRDQLRGGGPVDREAEARDLDEIVGLLDDAQEAGRRIARIVKDLGILGRTSPDRTKVQLIDVVNLATRWLPAMIGDSVRITVEDQGGPPVMASPGQIEQVVLNLVTNAAKATPEQRRGGIAVRVGQGSPGMARLEVADRGVGIAPELLGRIFDPFFTTRGVGQGSGLGLSICHAIVSDHGGTLTVESEVGKGSVFRLELPAASP
jgi:PAS domain S-box-containing protein